MLLLVLKVVDPITGVLNGFRNRNDAALIVNNLISIQNLKNISFMLNNTKAAKTLIAVFDFKLSIDAPTSQPEGRNLTLISVTSV